jgi:hypothetical protein
LPYRFIAERWTARPESNSDSLQPIGVLFGVFAATASGATTLLFYVQRSVWACAVPPPTSLATSVVLPASSPSCKHHCNIHLCERCVEEAIALLEMDTYAEAVVGVLGEDPNVEQRKCLTIAVELVAKPTSGLVFAEGVADLCLANIC